MKDIVRGTRAVAMVALQADKLPAARATSKGSGVTSTRPSRRPRRTSPAARCCARPCGAREFMASHDLPAADGRGAPVSVEQPYPTEINGKTLDDYTEWFIATASR